MSTSTTNEITTYSHQSYDNKDDVVMEDGVESIRVVEEPNKGGMGRVVGGAAVIGGIAGLALVGPIVGVVAAGGAAIAAVASRGAVGNVVRKSGEITADTGDAVREFDQKHKILENTSKGLSTSFKWVSEKFSSKKTGPGDSTASS